MALSYEEQRLQNIKDNEALLLSLGLSLPSSKPKASKPTAKKGALTAKRSNVESGDEGDFQPGDEGDDEPVEVKRPAKKARLSKRSTSVQADGVSTPTREVRRSARNTSTPDYTGRQRLYVEVPSSSRAARRARADSESDDEGRMRNAQKLGIRTQDPKTFGHIPGVEVGRWWATRMDCSTDAVHAPTVAGISGNSLEGAYSVALSGGYPDDVDLGYAFTYTGSGGRDLKGTKQKPKNLRTAPQSFDQSFDNTFNAALKRSAETRLPVRVIRGFKLDSPYAPATGYRYDGLYVVERAWLAKGLTKGLKVCRYAFRRVEGQDELPVRSDEGDEDEED